MKMIVNREDSVEVTVKLSKRLFLGIQRIATDSNLTFEEALIKMIEVAILEYIDGSLRRESREKQVDTADQNPYIKLQLEILKKAYVENNIAKKGVQKE